MVIVANTLTTPRTIAGIIPAFMIVFRLYPPAVIARGTIPVAMGVINEDIEAMLHRIIGPIGSTFIHL